MCASQHWDTLKTRTNWPASSVSPQVTNHSDEPHQPLLTLRPWLRGLISLFLVALAVSHVLWPDIPIDAVFLGLLAFAGLLWFFDVDSIEWQGIRARRRQIAKVRAALKEEPPSREVIAAVVPEVPKPSTAPPSPSPPVTVHAQPTDLNPPVDKLDRLLWGAEQIRIELIVLLGNAGHLKRVAPWSDFSLAELIRLAADTKILGGSTANAILTVAKMRTDLPAGETTAVELPTEGEVFDMWTAHPEMSPCTGV